MWCESYSVSLEAINMDSNCLRLWYSREILDLQELTKHVDTEYELHNTYTSNLWR